MLNELRDLDFRDLGSASLGVKLLLLIILFAGIVIGGYYYVIKEQRESFLRSQQKELELRAEFEEKQQKAANLEEYEAQLAEMEVLLESMLRQLPSRTEMDKILVDISQTALASGIRNELFQPGNESVRDFYAEHPISIRMQGNYHQFGEFISGVATLPRVVVLTMHDIALRRSDGGGPNDLLMEGTVKTYRYVDEDEKSSSATEAQP